MENNKKPLKPTKPFKKQKSQKQKSLKEKSKNPLDTEYSTKKAFRRY